MRSWVPVSVSILPRKVVVGASVEHLAERLLVASGEDGSVFLRC